MIYRIYMNYLIVKNINDDWICTGDERCATRHGGQAATKLSCIPQPGKKRFGNIKLSLLTL